MGVASADAVLEEADEVLVVQLEEGSAVFVEVLQDGLVSRPDGKQKAIQVSLRSNEFLVCRVFDEFIVCVRIVHGIFQVDLHLFYIKLQSLYLPKEYTVQHRIPLSGVDDSVFRVIGFNCEASVVI